jgi:porphobilinogen deaminase
LDEGVLKLAGVVLSIDGRERLFAEGNAAPEDAETLGAQVAKLLLDQGASRLISALRHTD